MRDAEVRSAVLSRLQAAHAGDTDTRIVEEMGVWAGSARIDIAVINGELAGFELKSERDTLERLPLQAEIYGMVFDKVHLVTTERHLAKAIEIVPSWWGTFIAYPEGRDVGVRELRRAKQNPSPDPHIVAQLLWREEALDLLDQYGLSKGYRSKTAAAIHRKLADDLPLPQLMAGVRSALKRRDEWLR